MKPLLQDSQQLDLNKSSGLLFNNNTRVNLQEKGDSWRESRAVRRALTPAECCLQTAEGSAYTPLLATLLWTTLRVAALSATLLSELTQLPSSASWFQQRRDCSAE